MGGTDDPSNIVRVTIKEHALLHLELYFRFGHEEDKLAYHGLIGNLQNQECQKLAMSLGGKKAAKIRAKKVLGKTYDEIYGVEKSLEIKNKIANRIGKKPLKRYQILYPDGTKIIVNSLKNWCIKQNINYNTLHKQTISRSRPYRGFFVTVVL